MIDDKINEQVKICKISPPSIFRGDDRLPSAIHSSLSGPSSKVYCLYNVKSPPSCESILYTYKTPSSVATSNLCCC